MVAVVAAGAATVVLGVVATELLVVAVVLVSGTTGTLGTLAAGIASACVGDELAAGALSVVAVARVTPVSLVEDVCPETCGAVC